MFGKSSRVHAMKPVARKEGLSFTHSGDETLVYDRDRFVIHRLDTESAMVWEMADGNLSIEELSRTLGIPIRCTVDAIDKLATMGLLQYSGKFSVPFPRRLLLGGAAGAVASGTFIPAAAASCDQANGTYLGGCYHPDFYQPSMFCISGKVMCCKGSQCREL